MAWKRYFYQKWSTWLFRKIRKKMCTRKNFEKNFVGKSWTFCRNLQFFLSKSSTHAFLSDLSIDENTKKLPVRTPGLSSAQFSGFCANFLCQTKNKHTTLFVHPENSTFTQNVFCRKKIWIRHSPEKFGHFVKIRYFRRRELPNFTCCAPLKNAVYTKTDNFSLTGSHVYTFRDFLQIFCVGPKNMCAHCSYTLKTVLAYKMCFAEKMFRLKKFCNFVEMWYFRHRELWNLT